MNSDPSSDLHAAAKRCLAASDPTEKCALTRATARDLRDGRLRPVSDSAVEMLHSPGRPARPHLVPPRALAQRGLGTELGRAAFIHAIAHIEFNAIDLAWDAVYRFREMPVEFRADWAAIADDEARHFLLLQARLADLGHAYGDFDAHNGLWEMAERTAHSCLERMALVPRVLEARGLDVTPSMIARLRAVGDQATVEVLEVILREEIGHVAAGSRWFRWCCAREGVDPDSTFETLLQRHAGPALRGPFNRAARVEAGFSDFEMSHIERLAQVRT